MVYAGASLLGGDHLPTGPADGWLEGGMLACERLIPEFPLFNGSSMGPQSPSRVRVLKSTRARAQEAMSGVYNCMNLRRGCVFEENPREGTPLIQVESQRVGQVGQVDFGLAP